MKPLKFQLDFTVDRIFSASKYINDVDTKGYLMDLNMGDGVLMRVFLPQTRLIVYSKDETGKDHPVDCVPNIEPEDSIEIHVVIPIREAKP